MPTATMLFLNSSTDYRIVDEHGTTYTPEQARTLWETGKLKDYNQSFHRLMLCGFSIEAVKKYYAEAGIARGQGHS